MIRAFVLIFFLLTSVTWADWVPKGFKKWQDSEDTTVHRKRIGGEIANYQKQDKSWAPIENDWVKVGQRHKCQNSLLKVDVGGDGESIVELTYGDSSYTVTQQLVKIGIIDTTTWEWRGIIRMPDWGKPTVTGNVMRWENLTPAIDYEIEKGNGVARHRIVFNTDFLENVRFVYRQSHDSSRFALANKMVFVMSGNIPDTLGLMNEWVLADLGDHIFLMPRQTLHFAGRDTMPELETVVRQRWERSGDTLFCTEYVMASELIRIFDLFPDSGMHHNDETKVIDGTTNVEDAMLHSGVADNNYGGSENWYLDGDEQTRAVIRVKNVASELGGGATISACACSSNCYTEQGFSNNVSAYRVFKPYVEGDENGVNDDDGDVTWNDWASDANEWTTAGCESADDGGSDNSGDGTGADRKATAEDTEGVDAVGWYGWDISSDLAQGWYAGTINEEGVVLINAGSNYKYFRSTEYASDQPFWTFTYTTGGAPTPNRRRAMMLR